MKLKVPTTVAELQHKGEHFFHANLPSLPPHTGAGPYKTALTQELCELQSQLPHLNYEMPPNDQV